jgi:hypothetical protein
MGVERTTHERNDDTPAHLFSFAHENLVDPSCGFYNFESSFPPLFVFFLFWFVLSCSSQSKSTLASIYETVAERSLPSVFLKANKVAHVCVCVSLSRLVRREYG